MPQEQRISVIVPIYKVEAYLDRCVESIVNQTYRNLEIILVDDGSPDYCPAMCDAWAKKDGRIKVIHKPNGGLSDARNAGMAIASGEYIGFVDSDDWIAPEMYERLANALEQDGSDIAACGIEMIWEDGRSPRCLISTGREALNREQAMETLICEKKLVNPVVCKLYKRKITDGVLFPVGKYHEDVFWSYQAIGKAEKVSVINYIGYFYWQRSGSIMDEKYSLRRLDAIEAICQRHEYIKKDFPKLVTVSAYKIWIDCLYHGQMALYDLSGPERKKVLTTLKKTITQNPIPYMEAQILTRKQRMWLCLEKMSLETTCWLRNMRGLQ